MIHRFGDSTCADHALSAEASATATAESAAALAAAEPSAAEFATPGSTAAEAPAAGGALVAFLRSDHSWHGHLPFVGERRVIQFNWVTDNESQRFAIFRHRVSASVKQMLSFGKSSKDPRPLAPERM
jgi:hypothetical protein